MKRIVKIRKAGNSLIITIPRDLLDDLGWKEDDNVFLESEPQVEGSYLTGFFKGQKILKIGKID